MSFHIINKTYSYYFSYYFLIHIYIYIYDATLKTELNSTKLAIN